MFIQHTMYFYFFSHRCGFVRIPPGTLDFSRIKKAIKLAYGTSVVLLRCPFSPVIIPVKLESRQQRWCDLIKDIDNVQQKEGIKPTCRVICTLFQNTFTIDYSKDLHMERLVGYVYDDSDQSTQYYTIYNDYKTVSITPLYHIPTINTGDFTPLCYYKIRLNRFHY